MFLQALLSVEDLTIRPLDVDLSGAATVKWWFWEMEYKKPSKTFLLK